MQPLRNAVFRTVEHPTLPEADFRILDISPDGRSLVLFQLGLLPDPLKPFIVGIDKFSQWQADGLIEIVASCTPAIMLRTEDDLPEDAIKLRDQRYTRIQDLVEEPDFLTRYAAERRSKLVVGIAKQQGCAPRDLYRLIKRFWEYGQVPNALLDNYEQCGAPGKRRLAGTKQRGAPLDQGQFITRSRKSVNIDDNDFPLIEYALQQVINDVKVKQTKFTFRRVYKKLKRLPPYCEEIERAADEGRAAQIPSYKQLIYWLGCNIGRMEIDQSVIPSHVWQKDYRGLTSSSKANAPIPGSRYEIDSTVADVYVVADYDRNIVLGRPTLYVVVDVASRMIAGFHVSLEWASWDCARQALYNAFTDKVAFCKRYGIDITSEEWPSVGVPMSVLCDRAELLGDRARVLPGNLGTELDVAQPYRGDVKGIVERRFGIANEDLHFLPGTTLGQLRERGEPDYRLKSVLTLNEVTTILCSLFHHHNTQRKFDDLLTADMIAADLAHTPAKYWNLMVGQHRHALKHHSEDEIIAALLPKVSASVTDRGIFHKEMRFSCDRAKREEWFTKVRREGKRWRIEARGDLGWTSDLYVRVEGESQFTKCDMIDTNGLYLNRHPSDITYLREWRREKEENASADAAAIEHDERVDKIVDRAAGEKRNTPSDLSDAARKRGISENRRKAVEEQKQVTRPIQQLPERRNRRAVKRSMRLIKGGLDDDASSPD